MKKTIYSIIVLMVFMVVGCSGSFYKEDKAITKYAKDKKYFEKLAKGNVKFLKCYPSSDGKKMEATFTTFARDNDFPATIRFNYVNKTYNLYFDNAYLNGPKAKLLKDIDGCFSTWETLTKTQATWK